MNLFEADTHKYICGDGYGPYIYIDGTGDGPGVLTKVVGPVLIRFHSDDKPGANVRKHKKNKTQYFYLNAQYNV